MSSSMRIDTGETLSTPERVGGRRLPCARAVSRVVDGGFPSKEDPRGRFFGAPGFFGKPLGESAGRAEDRYPRRCGAGGAETKIFST